MRTLYILAVLLLADVAIAGPYSALTITGPLTIGTNTVVATNSVELTGRPVAFSAVSSGGAATVTVTTASGFGSSLGAAKTIFPAAVVTSGGVQTNFAVNQYLANDRIVLRSDNGAVTGSVTPLVIILYEK